MDTPEIKILKAMRSIYQAMFIEHESKDDELLPAYEDFFSRENDPLIELRYAILELYDVEEEDYSTCFEAISAYLTKDMEIDELVKLLENGI